MTCSHKWLWLTGQRSAGDISTHGCEKVREKAGGTDKYISYLLRANWNHLTNNQWFIISISVSPTTRTRTTVCTVTSETFWIKKKSVWMKPWIETCRMEDMFILAKANNTTWLFFFNGARTSNVPETSDQDSLSFEQWWLSMITSLRQHVIRKNLKNQKCCEDADHVGQNRNAAEWITKVPFPVLFVISRGFSFRSVRNLWRWTWQTKNLPLIYIISHTIPQGYLQTLFVTCLLFYNYEKWDRNWHVITLMIHNNI